MNCHAGRSRRNQKTAAGRTTIGTQPRQGDSPLRVSGNSNRNLPPRRQPRNDCRSAYQKLAVTGFCVFSIGSVFASESPAEAQRIIHEVVVAVQILGEPAASHLGAKI